MISDWVIEGWGEKLGYSVRFCSGKWVAFLRGGYFRKRFDRLLDAITFCEPLTKHYRRFRRIT